MINFIQLCHNKKHQKYLTISDQKLEEHNTRCLFHQTPVESWRSRSTGVQETWRFVQKHSQRNKKIR